MATTPPLSDFLNVMFTAEHLSEMIKLGNSARKRLAITPPTYEQYEMPPYLWFIHPRYLMRFVVLGQQAQAEQDAHRVIGLEAALHVLSSKYGAGNPKRLATLPISDDSSTPTMSRPMVINTAIITRSYSSTRNFECLKGRECVAIDVAIWIIDHLRYHEGYCTRCSHGVTVHEYGGGYFDGAVISGIKTDSDSDAQADYAVTCNSQGGLALYKM